MRYQRSLEIENRLQSVLDLIQSGGYSTPALAVALQVSIPTISRAVEALRERDFEIEAERGEQGWHYVLKSGPARASNRRQTPNISEAHS
jgi:predicted DNA-binding transcriptional regulator YafY